MFDAQEETCRIRQTHLPKKYLQALETGTEWSEENMILVADLRFKRQKIQNYKIHCCLAGWIWHLGEWLGWEMEELAPLLLEMQNVDNGLTALRRYHCYGLTHCCSVCFVATSLANDNEWHCFCYPLLFPFCRSCGMLLLVRQYHLSQASPRILDLVSLSSELNSVSRVLPQSRNECIKVFIPTILRNSTSSRHDT